MCSKLCGRKALKAFHRYLDQQGPRQDGKISVVERNGRYEYRDLPGGVDERPLVSIRRMAAPSAADKYTTYAHLWIAHGRVSQSCIIARQFGIEDQGWVA
jgi:CDP-paratose 2-epimerase